VGGDELRSMSVFVRSFRRMSWLSFNLVLSIIAASVIIHFETTIDTLVALAFFIPVIGNMSGCSGNQAVGVSIRELALGLTRPEDWHRVFLKELQVGLINGMLLGILLTIVAVLLNKGAYVGLVAGAALALNTLVALSLGGLVPLVLRKFDIDPALSAPPIVTTLADMCGFLIFLSAATWLLM
jgi:magnesium transporter